MKNNNFYSELELRDMLHQATQGADNLFKSGEVVTGYIGFDPTASALHIGNLVAVNLLRHLQIRGHKPIILIGGATGFIGDPAGKSAERKFLTPETIEQNAEALKKQFSKFLDFDKGEFSAEIVNNYDWLKGIGLIDFLREQGKVMSVNEMQKRDSVKKRLEGDAGISLTEFMYQALQAFDFKWLYENKNCKLQMGGSDQFGNITAGTELIRKTHGQHGHGITCPLLLKSDGGKFGKTEDGNIWLDATMTSAYKFYQYWRNVDDKDIANPLRFFTFFEIEEIKEMEEQYKEKPNELKEILAREITTRVHSQKEYEEAYHISKLLFGDGNIEEMEAVNEEVFNDAIQGLNKFAITKAEFKEEYTIADGLAKVFDISKGEAKRFIAANSVRINKTRLAPTDANARIPQHLIKGKHVFMQIAKKFGVLTVV